MCPRKVIDRQPKMANRLATMAALAAAVVVAGTLGFKPLQRAYHVYRGQSDLRHARIDAAIEWLEQAERISGQRADIQFWLGVAYRRAGRLDDALKHFEKAARLGWPPGDLDRERLLARFQAGDRRAVEPELQDMLDSAPRDEIAAEIYETFAKGYLSDFRFKEAIVCLNYWIEWQPDCIEARLLRADAFGVVEDWNEEQKDLNHVLGLAPDRLDARLRLARSLMDRHEIDAALTEYQRCHEILPSDRQAVAGMAQCEYRLGRYADAGRHAEAALASATEKPQRALAMVILGQIAIEEHRYQEAVDLLKEAIRLEPHDPSGHYNLGRALNRLGDKQGGQKAMEECDRLEKLRARLSDIGLSVLRSRASPELRCEAGQVLRELGNPDAAIRWYLSALAADPTNIEAHTALAAIYRAQGKPALAAQHEGLANQRRSPSSHPSKGLE